MTDVLEVFRALIANNWNASNTGSRTPTVALRHAVKTFDLTRGDFVFVYPTSPRQEDYSVFGHTSYDVNDFVSFDVYTGFSDAQSQLMRDEVKRIINNFHLDVTTTGYHQILRPTITDRRDFFRKVYHYVLDYPLQKFNEAVTT